MQEDIILLSCISLEVLVLIFFIRYIIQYMRQYHEIVDPFTKWTLILLSISFAFQICRLPLIIMRLAYENSSDDDYDQWYLQ